MLDKKKMDFIITELNPGEVYHYEDEEETVKIQKSILYPHQCIVRRWKKEKVEPRSTTGGVVPLGTFIPSPSSTKNTRLTGTTPNHYEESLSKRKNRRKEDARRMA